MENNNKSGLPIAIIGIVLLAAVGLGAWFYVGSTKKNPANSNTSANKASVGIPNNSPPGASPAWTQGPPSALVTVEEFADFQCPTCAMMHPKVKELRAVFGDRVRIIFRQFPLQGHPYGYDAACAAEAAGAQGKFWEMQNLLFSNQQAWANSATIADARRIFTDYAKTLGLDVARFENEMTDLRIKNRVDEDIKRGRAVGVGSTPSFFVNGKPLAAGLDGLRSEVDAELKKAEASKQSQTTPANAAVGNANK